jgi:hypothetical protein
MELSGQQLDKVREFFANGVGELKSSTFAPGEMAACPPLEGVVDCGSLACLP